LSAVLYCGETLGEEKPYLEDKKTGVS